MYHCFLHQEQCSCHGGQYQTERMWYIRSVWRSQNQWNPVLPGLPGSCFRQYRLLDLVQFGIQLTVNIKSADKYQKYNDLNRKSIFFFFDFGFLAIFSPSYLICIFVNKAFENCQEQNLYVKSDAPVLNVVQVTVYTLPDGCISAVTIDLCPSCKSGTHLMLDHVSRYFLTEFLYKERSFRSWSYQAHIAFQNIKKL